VVKSRVHDLAAEFGVSSEQLLAMLKDMNIFVRSHMSALEGDQVSAVRVRWEREKRKQHEEEKPKKARRKKAAETPAEVPAPVADAGKPSKRRRTAAEVAQVEALHQAEREEEEKRVAMLELERAAAEPEPVAPSLSLEERARQLFKDLPPAEPEAEEESTPQITPTFRAPVAPVAPTESAAPPARAPFIPPRVQRPAPPQQGGNDRGQSRTPGDRPRGPKPVFSSSFTSERPAPSRGGSGGPPAATPSSGESQGGAGGRPGKKGKKGRRSQVDRDAVQANIEKTLQGLKGSAGKKVRRADGPSYQQLRAGEMAEEKEREKTLIRVNEFISVSELAGLMKGSWKRPTRPRTWCLARPSSRSWATSTTARRRCSTTCARRTSSRVRPVASPSTLAPTTSTSLMAGRSPSSTPRVTRPSPPCAPAARR